jgi:phosphomannomutase
MNSSHRFHPTVLRAYDIRGIVGETLSAADARAVGRGFATAVADKVGRAPILCAGYDGRLSSPELEAAMVEGMMAAGAIVWRAGRGPTPMLYFAARTLGADGGVMVTGSHNPPTHNGFKMMIGKASFFGEDIQEMGRRAAAGDVRTGSGSMEERPVFDAYVARLAEEVPTDSRPLAVAWDAGNGAAGEAMAALARRLPGRHVLLHEAIDGRFPNHHPDPTVEENLEDLRAAVARERCDLGIAFDGDGDRIGVIDGKGRVLWGDQLLAIWAEDVLAERPGATIIADIKASQTLFDHVAARGGKPLMWRSGHSMIKAKMAETGAPLAGEMSGHIFFADRYFGFDDALYAAVRLLAILGRPGPSLADRLDALPRMVATPELRFDCSEERKFAVIEEVKSKLVGEGAEMVDIDGVRVRRPEGWWLLRASNTQAVLVARCEAADANGLARLKQELVSRLGAAGVQAPAGL